MLLPWQNDWIAAALSKSCLSEQMLSLLILQRDLVPRWALLRGPGPLHTLSVAGSPLQHGMEVESPEARTRS